MIDVGRIESLEDRLLLTVELLNQTVVFNQASQFPGEFTYFGSSIDSSQTTGGVVYDDFSFAAATKFDTVTMQGLFEAGTLAANPANPNTDFWRVNIWNDNGFGTGPGTTLLATEDILIEDSFGEFVGYATLGTGAQAPVFNVAMGLSESFEASANTVYWLSVVSVAQGANDPVWNWMSGAGDDGGSIQQISGISGNLLRSGDRAFRLGQSSGPATPSITGPASSVDTARPTFTWSAVPGADHYDIWVNVRGSNQLVLRETNVIGTSFQPTTALPTGQSYVWTVRAVSSAGTPSGWATHSTFQINASLGTPTLTAPKGVVATTTPQFSWSAVNGADHYELWVNVQSTNAMVIHEYDVQTTSFTATQALPAGQSYIWTVRAVGADGTTGNWATHTSFSIAAAASVPSLIGPTGTSSSKTPTFSWSAVSGATYEIWVNVQGSNQMVFRQAGLTTNQFTSPVTLTSGTTYIWTVRAVVGGSAGSWSTHKTFKVASLGTLTAPLSGTATTEGGTEGIEPALEPERPLGEAPPVMLAENSHGKSHASPVAPARPVQDERREAAAPVESRHREGREGSAVALVAEAGDVDAVMAEWAELAWWATERAFAREAV